MIVAGVVIAIAALGVGLVAWDHFGAQRAVVEDVRSGSALSELRVHHPLTGRESYVLHMPSWDAPLPRHGRLRDIPMSPTFAAVALDDERGLDDDERDLIPVPLPTLLPYRGLRRGDGTVRTRGGGVCLVELARGVRFCTDLEAVPSDGVADVVLLPSSPDVLVVLLAASHPVVVGLDATDGHVRWRTELDAETRDLAGLYPFEGGLAVLVADAYYAIDPADGTAHLEGRTTCNDGRMLFVLDGSRLSAGRMSGSITLAEVATPGPSSIETCERLADDGAFVALRAAAAVGAPPTIDVLDLHAPLEHGVGFYAVDREGHVRGAARLPWGTALGRGPRRETFVSAGNHEVAIDIDSTGVVTLAPAAITP
jgi:hypothetical protein